MPGGAAATAVESSVSGIAAAVAATGGEQEHGRPGDDGSERGGAGDPDRRALPSGGGDRVRGEPVEGDPRGQLASDPERGDPRDQRREHEPPGEHGGDRVGARAEEAGERQART